MTIGYFDPSALESLLSPGAAGDRGSQLWKALDAVCVHEMAEIEVPSAIGRHVDRLAWMWTLNSLALVSFDDEIRGAAIDLAWLGVPALIAIHVATAERVSVDHFVTADAQAAEWASMRGLATVLLS